MGTFGLQSALTFVKRIYSLENFRSSTNGCSEVGDNRALYTNAGIILYSACMFREGMRPRFSSPALQNLIMRLQKERARETDQAWEKVLAERAGLINMYFLPFSH